MTKILFICHGNICRSPMAEFFMKQLVKEKGLENDFLIKSAATSREELGNSIYPPVRRILDARGIDYKGKVSVQVTRDDYNRYDYLVCMDKNNIRNLTRIIGEDAQNKVSLLLDFTDTPRDVADPWYTGNFDITENDIENGCKCLLNYLLKK